MNYRTRATSQVASSSPVSTNVNVVESPLDKKLTANCLVETRT